MDNMKHIGRVKATGRKVLVAYRTLPGESDAALVIQTEGLSDSQHDSIMKLVESPAGQNAYEFAEVMARTNFPDGGVMLNTLHVTGKLTKVRTSDIEMTPNLTIAISLDSLNQLIAEQKGSSVNDLALGNQTSVKDIAEVNEITSESFSINDVEPVKESAPSFNTPDDEAKFYRSQADKLSKQAAEFRRKAEELAPTKKKVSAAE